MLPTGRGQVQVCVLQQQVISASPSCSLKVRSEAFCRWEESMSASLEVLQPLVQVVQSLLYPANSSAVATQLLANAAHSDVLAPQLLHDANKLCTLAMKLRLGVVHHLQQCTPADWLLLHAAGRLQVVAGRCFLQVVLIRFRLGKTCKANCHVLMSWQGGPQRLHRSGVLTPRSKAMQILLQAEPLETPEC